jgi:hypothetical protein
MGGALNDMPECTRYQRRSLGAQLATGRSRINVVWQIENME